MLGTVLKRVFTSGLVSFWRNRWISSATIAIMVITLGLITGLVVLSAVTEAVLKNLQEQVDITVYFNVDTPESDIINVKEELERFPEVAEVEYVSREEALARFRTARAENPIITEALEQVGENPLEAQLNVRARDITQYNTIASFLEGRRFEEMIDEVNFRENQKVIDRLSAIISLVRRAGLILAILLVIVAVLVTFNTIRLTIYSLREEIGVMRLVGGSNWYIRGPFIVEGVAYGVIAALVTFILFLPVIYFISPKLIGFLPGIVLWQYFLANWWQILLLQVVLGVGLGVFSSFIAMRRYLKI